ncbi:MAG: tetratricopeptide repeat protein [Pyrinomonadaceae bacterium]
MTSQRKVFRLFNLLILLFVLASLGFAQIENDADAQKANNLILKNNFIDALPYLQKLIERYPNDVDLNAQLGIAYVVRSVIFSDAKTRESEVQKGFVYLDRARELGTKNQLALQYFEAIKSGGSADVFNKIEKPEVEAAIREGEQFFIKGDFKAARNSYQKAYAIDPNNYEAVIFIGDTYYSEKDFDEAIKWFRNASELDANREQAFRFWGDALKLDGKGKESIDKFAEAMIADPSSRIVINSFIDAVRNFGDRRGSPFILIPMREDTDELLIDESSLSESDGSACWKEFNKVRKSQNEEYKKLGKEEPFSATIADNAAALHAVAKVLNTEQAKNTNLKLSQSFKNLIKLDSLGFLDAYVAIFLTNARGEEYSKFRAENRGKLKKFLVDYFAEDKLNES